MLSWNRVWRIGPAEARTAVDEDDDVPANAATTAVVAVIKKGIHFVVIEIYCGSQGIHKEKGYNIT